MGAAVVNWQELLKDKRLWVGAAGAALVGLVVFVQRSRKAGKAPGNASSATPVGSTGYVQGGADTTGTDIASFLSSYSQALQGQLNEFGGNLNDTLTAIKNGQTGGQTTPNGNYETATINEGNWVNQWLTDHNIDLGTLLSLNPDLRGKIVQADAQGYISPSNPLDVATMAPGGVFNVGGPFTVKVPKAT